MQQDKKDLKQHARTILFLNGPFGLLIALPLAAVIRLLGVFEALVTGARQVEASELEATENELRQQVLTGRVKAADLVFVNGGWQTFGDSALFADICAEAESRTRWLSRLSSALSMALGFALVAGIVWVCLSIPRWLFSRD